MMNRFEKDILKDPSLRECPYKAPEGYFDAFKVKAAGYAKPVVVPRREKRRILFTISSMAASFILLLAAGTMLLNGSRKEDGITQEDYLVFSDSYSDFGIYEDNDEQYADASISDDDIIEYLIYIGVSEEVLELSE